MQLPPRPEQPANDHLLEDLVALTDLFNPERIWQAEEQLDKLDEQQAHAPTTPVKPAE